MTTLTRNKILVVDDKQEVVDFILEILELNDFSFYSASDGDEALDIFKKYSDIALVITDINMPRMNGIDLTRQIKSSACPVPVIVMTGYGDKEMIGKKIGDEFISKPFDIFVLLDLIRKYM